MRIIAEIGASHNGELKNALDLIKAASHCGADAVKVQLYDPAKLAEQRRASLGDPIEWQGKQISLIDLYTKAHTPRAWFPILFAYAKEVGIPLFSTVFHIEDVPLLEECGNPQYKVSAYEGGNTALIEAAAATGKPLIVSNPRVPLPAGAIALACVSEYPCSKERAIAELAMSTALFQIGGFSDHTIGSAVAVEMLKYGATVFEKHIKLEGDVTSPDADFAIAPDAFAEYVATLRRAAARKAA